jgi:hypothetical protein
MIYSALIIPIVAIIIAAIFFNRKMAWWEYILLFGIPLLCIIAGNYFSIYSQTRDIEYWNSYATKAVYEEEWKEKWKELVTEIYTDSDGKSHTRSHWETETRYHPPMWTIYDNIGGSYSIDQSFFEKLCKLWNNKSFVEMDRINSSINRFESSYKLLIDGDAYETIYDKNFTNTIPICKQHTYENKVQCSKSVFNFQEVNDKDKEYYKLFNYPSEDIFGFNPILGYNNPKAAKKLQIYNALNGNRYRLHMMLLIFNNQPLEAGIMQESYWKGGNKNEFIVCIGVKDNKITWTKVISWTNIEELKIKTGREIKEMQDFDIDKIVEYMSQNVPPKFVKKDFREFNYLSIQPSNRAIIITFIITLITTIGIFVFDVLNKFK